jgi:ADP-ribose pyrophosphatase
MTQEARSAVRRDARRVRYEALLDERPGLFSGTGPVRLDVDRDEPGIGVVHADPWIMLVIDPVVMPDGRPGRYARLMTTIDSDGVAVLPITQDGRVLLLNHWRHATQSWHLEIPRGFGEIGVSAEQQASIELMEEMQVEGTMVAMGHLHPDTGRLSGRVALFVALLPRDVVPVHDEGLGTVVEMTVAQFEDAIVDGGITDPFALAAWLRHSILRAGQAT